jgi:hypothetical protein
MKMANMDAVFDFMFTDPRNEDGVRFSLHIIGSTVFNLTI